MAEQSKNPFRTASFGLPWQLSATKFRLFTNSLNSSSSPKRLLLFDIDGTLIQSGGAGLFALKRGLAERFKIEDELNDIEIAGRTDSGIVVSILEKHRIATTPENVAAFLDSYVHFLSLELPQRVGSLLPGV